MITGTSRPIKDFLRQDRQYLIPRYQREYVWEEKQWDDLFDDLLKNYQKFSCNPSIEGHFIGSIVILEERKERYSKAHVIDGQQRGQWGCASCQFLEHILSGQERVAQHPICHFCP